jgi:hypothetical protein
MFVARPVAGYGDRGKTYRRELRDVMLAKDKTLESVQPENALEVTNVMNPWIRPLLGVFCQQLGSQSCQRR